MTTYEEFLKTKEFVNESVGISVSPSDIHPTLFEFQRDITVWALRKGRAAIFADCGLGKTFMQLEWARHIGGRVLIVAPLSVAQQTIREAGKIDLAVQYARTGKEIDADGIWITNYEMIKSFADTDLTGLVLDESSILKSLNGKTKAFLIEHFQGVRFRLCCTATPAPNDISELANHSHFLGILTQKDMMASFFVKDNDGWRMRRHAVDAFYRWMSSWAVAIRKPSDLEYDDEGFDLPELTIHDETVKSQYRADGALFPGIGLRGVVDRAAVRRETVGARVARAVAIAHETEGQVIVWCGLNSEADGVEALISDCVQVKGADSLDKKNESIGEFLIGNVRVLVTKPKIAGFGMNFQNAHTMIFVGLSDSYEAYYQCIRRCWRFGQDHPVDVHVVVTDHEHGIVENVRSKERHASEMTQQIVDNMRVYEIEEVRDMAEDKEVLETTEYRGKDWTIMQGDSVDEIKKIDDDAVHLSIYSPPFISLYQYTATERDIGNSKTEDQFFEHYGYIVDELLRITMAGRLTCVHVSQVPAMLCRDGYIGVKDFRGKTIQCYEDHGWIYTGEVCIDKDPQAQAIRTHSKALLFTQLKKDSSWLRPALADYVLVFRKPGDNPVAIHPEITNEQWIEWARPIWYGIRESETLNTREAKSAKDERHICPLQLGVIERCVALWSNPGETVFTPFAWIGSEVYQAIKMGRKGIGIELKPLYAETAAKNCERALGEREQLGLFDQAEEEQS